MKLVSIATVFAATASANDLMAMWESAAASSMEHVDTSGVPMDRKVMDIFSMSNIFNYGCWCYFGARRPVRGNVMDSVDGYCKQWYDNKDCIVIDDATCDPDIDYSDPFQNQDYPFHPSLDYDALCTSAGNADDCTHWNCLADATFLRDIFNHMAFNNLNQSLAENNGFDAHMVCHDLSMVTTSAPGSTTGPASTNAPTTTLTAPGGNHACCGDYPNRYPYRHRDQMTQCCGQNTYNSNLHCCADPSTSLLGSLGSC